MSFKEETTDTQVNRTHYIITTNVNTISILADMSLYSFQRMSYFHQLLFDYFDFHLSVFNPVAECLTHSEADVTVT